MANQVLPTGAGGGSEQWEHHIAQWFGDQYFQDARVPAPPYELEQFLVWFRPQKRRNRESQKAISISLPMPDDTGVWRATLTPEGMHQAWEQGLNGPLRTARRMISRLLDNVEQGMVSRPLVVVSGGTARNPDVKSYMTTLCRANRVPVVFTADFDVPIVHALVALSFHP
jgi:hypothetical protein